MKLRNNYLTVSVQFPLMLTCGERKDTTVSDGGESVNQEYSECPWRPTGREIIAAACSNRTAMYA